MSETTGFYSLKATLPGNKTYDFADLKGKVVLIVNTGAFFFAHCDTHQLMHLLSFPRSIQVVSFWSPGYF